VDLKTIIGSLLEIVAWSPSNYPRIVPSITDALEKAVAEEVGSWNVGDEHSALFASISKKAVGLIQVCTALDELPSLTELSSVVVLVFSQLV
jgi:hypothetical protein